MGLGHTTMARFAAEKMCPLVEVNSLGETPRETFAAMVLFMFLTIGIPLARILIEKYADWCEE